MSADNKSTSKIFIISFVILAICALLALGFFAFRRSSSSKANALSKTEYEGSKKYFNLKADSSVEDKKSALDDLIECESKFTDDSFYYSQLNLYKANVYKDLKEIENENIALNNIIENASGNNYLLSIALYRLAVNKDDEGLGDEAFELYKKLWDKFGKNSPYSQMSLFSMFRIKYAQGDEATAKQYADLLSENYPSATLSEFVKSLF